MEYKTRSFEMKRYTELYKELYNVIYPIDNKKFKERRLSNFVAMRGNRYNEKMGKDNIVRFMVVGRAVNGWGESMNTESADTYASQAVELFEQMNRFTSKTEWNMQNGEIDPYSEYEKLDENGNPEYNENGEKIVTQYHLKNSPFWRSALEIYKGLSSNELHEHSDWYEDIVWNNIYKVAPLKEGNPSTNLIYAQAKTCVKLLREEIRLLQPTHVLLVIDKSWISWTSRNKVMFDFMEAFEGYKCHCHSVLKDQKKEIVQSAFMVNDCKILVTCRPETTSRDDYKNAVIDAFNKFDN